MELVRLSSFYDFQYGKGNNNPDNGGQYPVYGSNGIIGWYDKYNSEDAPVIGHIGANCGSVVWAKGKHFVTYNGVICKIKDGCNPRYGYYLLLNSNLKSRFRGAAQPFISYDLLEKVIVYNPPKAVQDKIASILSAYDNLIENNMRRIRLLEQMAENLYKEWFVRFRFPGHDNAEFENGLPKGWIIDKIGNVCETIGGGTPSTEKPEYWDGDIKWVTPTDITSKNSLPLLKVEGRITEEGLKKSSAKLLPPYTILMTSRASIGFFGIAPYEVCTNQGFISIIPQKDNLRMYMLYMLKSRKDEIVANANGATFLEISKGRFRKMKMLLPTDSILESFENKAMTVFNAILKLEKQNDLLSRQRDLLLPRLMSGKLEVNI